MIRFKKDDGSNYPDKIQKKIKNISKIYLGLTYTPTYVSEGVRFISSQNISNDFLDLSDTKFISREEYEKSTSNAKPKRGDVLFTRVGSNLGHPVIVETDEDLCIFVSLGYVRVNKKEILNTYMKYWMNSSLFWNQVKRKAAGGAKVNLNTGWMNEFDIKIPCLEEQQKIADFLSSVDDVIATTEKEVAALEEQKKGAMQKIFSQEVRFKADDGSDYPEWEELKLEDCCNGFDNQRKPVSAAKRESGNVPYYGANGIQDYVKDYIFDGEYVLLAEDGGNFDDFATRPIAQYISGKAWVNNHAHVIQAKENSITKYIFYTLVHKDIRKYINGTSRSKLNQADMWMIQIPVPRLEEQQKIADFLSDFDTAIYLAKQELEQWKELKKGLLQQLFE